MLAQIVIAALLLGAEADARELMFGFGLESATRQREIEARFDAALDPADQRAWLEKFSSAPNHIGSPHNKANAAAMLQLYRSWGWDARIETFQVLYPTPVEVLLEMTAPTRLTARLREDNLVAGPEAAALEGALPAYNAYGADGDVTAVLVYVNYGGPEDYKELSRRGIDVRGKIVLARYGDGWRGLKPKLAAQQGAVGCLIYSDPRDDGYGFSNVYPDGGGRPADAMQRGTVYDATLYAGDPLTPGVGATRSAKRLSIKDAATLMPIPVLPIAYRDAEPLLAALKGPVAPPAWRGGLPLTYRIGPGPTTVRLKVKSAWALQEIHDVIAVMRGQDAPDEWVIRGNHHDGWVAGAWDPLSANVAMMAEAKAIGALVRAGYRPKRTLVYASWDGEEAGLLGSTEWVETHAAELKRKAVLYVNSDTNSRGLLGISGSQTLQRLVNEVANDVPDPEAGVSVGARKRARQQIDGLAKRPPGTAPPPTENRIVLEPLGSGSDFAPFAQHLGVATLSLGFGGESDIGGLYHTSYDTFSSFERFGDPGFKYGVTLAQTAGRLILRTAFADRLPFSFTEFAESVGSSLDEVKKLADTRRARAVDLAKALEDNSYRIASDPAAPVAPPAAEDDVPYFNFAPLENASARLKRSAAAFDKAAGRPDLDDERLLALNASLSTIESLLTDDRGLPNRAWFKNMITAPGLYAGYSASTLPGVREAIEWRDFASAEVYARIIGSRLDAYADRLDKATAILTEK